MITIKNLSFAYNGTTILNDICLTIASGERWAVIGKNGVGKTTLVRCIAGLEKVHGGSIMIREKDVSAYSPRSRAQIMAYIPQAQGMQLPYTVYEYVMMGRFPYQGFMAAAAKEDKRLVEEALELTDTQHFKDRPMNRLSGGELQLVLLAGAVSQRTEILLLDEPATFLDPLHQELTRQTLDRIHSEYHCTILTVTHDINTALFRYENICALVDGSVYYSGSAEGLLEKYDSALNDIYGLPFVKGSCEKGVHAFVLPKKK